ncbi:MAG: ATP-binding protein [Firmicutes bacterium]|nr:ATP-binding protein [Bacillota bacterium]
MSDRITISIPGKPEFVQVARIAAGSIAGIAGFDVEKVDDIEVALGEAWKLVTCHGHSLWGEKYELDAVVEDDKMIITFSDLGTTHDIEKTCKQCARCPEDGDLSVFVLNSLMNEVEMKSDENGNRSIRMVKVK